MNHMKSTILFGSLLAALALASPACGGEESGPAPRASSRRATKATKATKAKGPAKAAVDDMTGPEYQGDHSLPGDPAAGAVTYQQFCVACHAADGRGNGGVTGGNFVDDRRRLAKNNETLLRAIREGVNNTPPMPSWRGSLNDQQMKDVLSYVRQQFGTTP